MLREEKENKDMNIKGLRPLFYTKEQLVEFLVSCIDAVYKEELSYTDVFAEFPKMGIRIKSASNNSLDCSYWGQRVRVQTSNSKKKGAVMVDLTYYPK